MNITLEEIRATYKFNETSQNTVPQALKVFFEPTSFEDTIRNAISVDGDSDNTCCHYRWCGGGLSRRA